MADVDWKKIKAEYITSDLSYRKLAEKHKVHFRTLAHRAKQEKCVELRQHHIDEIVTESVEIAKEKAIDYKSMLYDLAYKVASDLVSFANEYTISDIVAMGLKPKDITGAIKDLEDALHIKPESDIKEQEARIANLRKQAGDDDSSGEIKITIASEAEVYSK